MTRENKLALIVGFGLVLFVGILVSDHLSTARRQAAASLQPGAAGRGAQPVNLGEGWLVYGSAMQTEPASARQATEHRVSDQVALSTTTTIPVANTGQNSPHYIVARGDTLQSICQRHYGTPSLDQRLALYNRLPDPDRLTPGTHLLLPTVEVLLGTADDRPLDAHQSVEVVATIQAHQSQPTESSMGHYTVQPGDTLSELAQRLLGSSRNTDRLFELNRDVLRHRDDLRVGASLRYPLSP